MPATDAPFALTALGHGLAASPGSLPLVKLPDAPDREFCGVGGVNRIVKADAIDYMRTMPDACVDAIVTDPPYCSGAMTETGRSAAKGQGLRSENIRKLGWFVGDNMGTAGLVWLLRAMAFEAVRVLKPTGSLLVFCDWRMVPNLAPAIESAGLRYQNQITWDKRSMGLGTGFRAQKEEILHFTNGSPEYFDFSTSNVMGCGRVRAQDKDHQTQKPVELISQLVRVVAPAGGLVLDPFAGSCTLAEACVQTGRNYLCLERDAAHCATGESRVLQVQRGFETGGWGGFENPSPAEKEENEKLSRKADQ